MNTKRPPSSSIGIERYEIDNKVLLDDYTIKYNMKNEAENMSSRLGRLKANM